MLTEDAPVEVVRQLSQAGLNHRPVLLSTSTDVALDGSPEQNWLVVSDERVSLVRNGRRNDVVLSLPLQEVDKFRACAGVGSGALQAQRAGVWVDLARYSNTLHDRFHKVADKLEQLRTTGELKVHPAEEVDPRRCPKCQLRLAAAGETCPRCLPRGAILSRVWELIRPQRRGTLALCALTIVGVLAELVPPKLQQYLVDHVLQEPLTGAPLAGFLQALLLVVLALAVSRVVLALVGAWKGRLATRIGAALTAELRGRLVERLQQLAVSHYDRHQVGSLMSRVAYDSEVLHGLVHQITAGFLLQILQVVGVGIMLLVINTKLALFTLIPVPLVIGSTWFFWRRIYPRYYRYWDAASKQVTALASMLAGIRVVKAFAQESREYGRFQRASEYHRTSRLWVEESATTYGAWMQIVFSLGGLIVWYVGGRDVIGKSMTLGSLIAFLAYLAMFYAPLATLSNFTTWLTSFLTGSKRVLELLDAPITVREPARPADTGAPRGSIVFDNVHFGYDPHQPVLKGISFEVQPGEMVGIVGRSGSGKTTLVNLLGRFYDVDDGHVLVDGVDVRQYSGSQLRQRIGIVFQETYLFRGTIWDNLSYGQPEATIEQGLAAAKAARAHDFILRSPLGYDTPLGEQGAGLSGGEKQRLSLARALLYDPPILVLDEATSNIDTEAERMIQQALVHLTKGRTTIAIAHRLSTLRNADRILVFDRGRLAEEGTHEQLLADNGIYARMVAIQTQLTRDANVDKLSDEVDQSAKLPSATDGSQGGQVAKSSSKPADHSLRPAPASSANRDRPSIHPPAADQEVPWLAPATTHFTQGPLSTLQLSVAGQEPVDGVFVVCAFPTNAMDRYLSLRVWEADGDDREIGMIRDLAEWPQLQRELVEERVRRRYLFRRISAINSLDLHHGHLWFDVQTDLGQQHFCMRWSQSQAIEFGQHGKLIYDTEDNQYVIADLQSLSPADLELFRRFVYW